MTSPKKDIIVAAILKADGDLWNDYDTSVNNAWNVILSSGSSEGVRLGQSFLIYTLGQEIFDPINGNSLGFYEVVRGKGEVIQVQDNLCTIRSKETRAYSVPSTNALAVAAGMPSTKEEREIPFPLIRVGDLARRI